MQGLISMASSSEPKIRVFSWKLILILILLAVGVGGAGYLYYENQKVRITRDKQNELVAIAELKVNQIVNWRKERLGDAGMIAGNPYITSWIEPLMKDRPPSRLREDALRWMASLQRYYPYKDLFLVDSKGRLRLATVKGGGVLASYDREAVFQAIHKKEPVLSDLHRDESSTEIHIDLIAPLLTGKEPHLRPIGALLLRIDPYQFLYPFIQSWPAPSPTSETLLVRREGNDVVFLNDLRHRKGAALSYRFSIDEPRLPAAMAVRGKTGIVQGRDYRGGRVLAAIRAIPDSPWFLVAKIDVEEIEVPLRERAWIVQILVIVLIAAAGTSIGFLRARQIAKLELEREALELHYGYLSKYANDIILLLDQNWNVVEANDRAVLTYGYSRDELIGMNIRRLRAPEVRYPFDDPLTLVEKEGMAVFESVHQRRNGTTFPVEVSSRFIEVDGKKFYQDIVRDITKRKQQEAQLQRTAEDLARSNGELEQFAYVASHDLKQPLLSIGSYLQLLTRRYKDKLDSTADDFITHAVGGVSRMEKLIDDLLAYSRVGMKGKSFEPVSGETVLSQALDNLAASVKESGAQITYDPLPKVSGDPPQLIQLFQNLIGNAIKFRSREATPCIHVSATLNPAASEGAEKEQSAARHGTGGVGTIVVPTRTDRIPKFLPVRQAGEVQSECVFSVRDNGIGIDPKETDRIFVIFRRLHSQEEYPGTGIGLAICKKIVERHGGRIWVESEPGKGSTFYFTLPCS